MQFSLYQIANTYYYRCKLWAINVYCTSIVGEEIIKDPVKDKTERMSSKANPISDYCNNIVPAMAKKNE